MVLPRFMLGKSNIGNARIGSYFTISRVFKVLLGMVLFILISGDVSAQVFNRKLRDRNKNLADYDRQRFHFGFSLGINNTDFIVKRIPNLGVLDSVYYVEPRPQMGFNLGIISDMRIGKMFNLRFIPTLSFADRVLEYKVQSKMDTVDRKPLQYKVESTFLEFPLSMKFKSIRPNDGNWRAYILAGGKFTYDLASQKNIEEREGEIVIKLDKMDYSYEVGVGFDFYLQYFKFSPELKVSFGLNDQLVRDETIFTQSIASLNSKTFLISFHFE